MAEPAARFEAIGVLPASLDPIHIAHVHLAERAASLLDKLYVAVAVNPDKAGKGEFSVDERVSLANAALAHLIEPGKVEVITFERSLTVDNARELGARTMIRGARSVTDFEQEIDLHMSNIYAQAAIGIVPGNPDFVDTQTFYRMPNEEHVSSSLIRYLIHGPSISRREERIRPLVPEPVFEAILPRLPAEG